MNFKLTSEKKVIYGTILHRIQATKDLPNGIKKGNIGGFIEKKENIKDNGWVFGNAVVSGNALVSGNARVYDNAVVFSNARVHGNAEINSINSIIVIDIFTPWIITITKKLIFIGSKEIKSNKIKKITQKQAEKLGLNKKYYKPCKEMLLGALKLVR